MVCIVLQKASFWGYKDSEGETVPKKRKKIDWWRYAYDIEIVGTIVLIVILSYICHAIYLWLPWYN